jgi:hypothetical protein
MTGSGLQGLARHAPRACVGRAFRQAAAWATWPVQAALAVRVLTIPHGLADCRIGGPFGHT